MKIDHSYAVNRDAHVLECNETRSTATSATRSSYKIHFSSILSVGFYFESYLMLLISAKEMKTNEIMQRICYLQCEELHENCYNQLCKCC